MPRERVIALEDLVKTNQHWDKKDPPELQLRHDLMRAKLAGFLERPDTVARRYPSTDTSLPARYARAIAAYRFGGLSSALAQIDALIQTQPNNPYFHELKGQALLEGAQPAAGDRAAAPRRRACAECRADPHHARPGAGRDRREQAIPTRRSRSCASRCSASRTLRTSIRSSPWRMAARAISPKPISPPRRRRLPAAT